MIHPLFLGFTFQIADGNNSINRQRPTHNSDYPEYGQNPDVPDYPEYHDNPDDPDYQDNRNVINPNRNDNSASMRSINSDMCYFLKPPSTQLLNIKASTAYFFIIFMTS